MDISSRTYEWTYHYDRTYNLNNSELIPYLDGLFWCLQMYPLCHTSNTQMLGQMLINCKFPMTSKSNMLHGVNHPYMVICNQSAIFTIVLLVAYLNLYTFNTFNSIIIRTPEFSCSIKGHCTPVRKYASVFHINTTYIVNVNVYNEWLYTNTKKPADTMEVDPYSST